MTKKAKLSVAAVVSFGLICAGIGYFRTLVDSQLSLLEPSKRAFQDPQASLNAHFNQDFGVTLPAAISIKNAYWVNARDPEHVFELEMAPAEMILLMDQIAKSPRLHADEIKKVESVAEVHPLFDVPSWWNVPALADGEALEIFIKDSNGRDCGYGILWSRTKGHAFIYWCGF